MAGTKPTILMALALCAGVVSLAHADIVLPHDNDEYSKLVARAQSGDQTVDFHALRFAFLKSAAHKRGGLLGDSMALQKEMYAAVQANDAAKARTLAENLISADYINMHGHKVLRQACAILKDQACADREHFIEFGLLNSITHSGDGKTCKTGWEVVTVAEEYFIIAMSGARPQGQALINGPPACDQMTVMTEAGGTQVLYFRIDAVLADEASMLSGNR